MSTATRRWALASFSTSLLLAGVVVAADATLPTASSLEREVALARHRGVYLVVDPCAKLVRIKARGIDLDTLPLKDVAVLSFQRTVGGGGAPSLELPAVWKVDEAPAWPQRAVEAPATLRPYTGDESEPTPPPGTTPTPIPTPTPVPLPPVRYTVGLTDGWQLQVGPSVAARNPVRRLAASLADSWRRLRGVKTDHPPVLAVAIDPDAARELFHLFQPGIDILVLECAPTG